MLQDTIMLFSFGKWMKAMPVHLLKENNNIMYPLWEYFEFKTFCDIKYTYLIICEFLCFLYTCSLIYVALWYCWSYSVFCAKILLPIFIYLQYVLVNNSQKIISSSNPSSSNLLIGFFYFPKWYPIFLFCIQ